MSAADTITLAVVGDFWVNRPLPRDEPGLETVLDRLRAADLSVCVLEMPLSRRGAPAEKIVRMRASPERVEDLHHLGVDCVTIANNHMLDYGPDALLDTLEVLRSEGIPYVGAGRDIEEASRPMVLETGGIRVAFLACAATLPLGSAAGKERPGVNPLHVFTAWVVEPSARTQEQPGTPPPAMTFASPEDVRTLQNAVREAKRSSDIVVVLPHWGLPNVSALMHYQRDAGHALAAAGADLIVGHHAHCIQPVEVAGSTPIVYGVSNFLFHELPEGMSRNVYDFMSKDELLVEARLGVEGVRELSLTPLVLDSSGHALLAGPEDAARILGEVSDMSAEYGTVVELEGGRGMVGLGEKAALSMQKE